MLSSTAEFFIGKAATFNLMYGLPLVLLGEVDSWVGAVARVIGWAFVWWGTGLYWVAGLMYAAQIRDLVRSGSAPSAGKDLR